MPAWVDTFAPFWAGDALGALTLGGAIVAWRRSAVRWTARATVQAVAWLVTTAVVTAIGFWPRQIPLAYLVIPLLFWFAARYGMRMVAAGGTVVAVTANAMTAAGRGPWQAFADVPQLEMATLQLFIAVVVLSAWILAVEIADRQLAHSGLRAEISARSRMQALQGVTARLATAATSEAIARTIVHYGIPLVAEQGGVTCVTKDGKELRRWTTDSVHGHDPDETGAPLALDAALPEADAIRTGEPIILRDEQPTSAQVCHHLAVPARAGSTTLGALGFGFPSTIDPELLDVAETLADVTALALERARLYELEHAAAHELQQALLPPVDADLPRGAGGGPLPSRRGAPRRRGRLVRRLRTAERPDRVGGG